MGFFKRLSKKKQPEVKTTLVPGVGRLPCPAYQGNEPYIFISYSHADSDRVFAEIKRFNEAGYNIWYDEGISPGNEWDDEIADALEKCSLFVVFLSKNSVNSKNVKNEIDFAIDDNIPAIGIYLEPCELKGGLKLRFRNVQAIMKYTITAEEEYVYKFTKAFAKYGFNYAPRNKENKENESQNTANKPVMSTEPPVVPAKTEAYNDSPEDAKKRANGDLVRVDGYDIEHGSLKGYFGSDKDLKIPNSAIVIGSTAFQNCRLFVESIDLNRAGCILDHAFSNCPKLHTVKVPPTVTTIKMNAFYNCPNVTLYVRRSQLPDGFEDRFSGKKIVYQDEEASVSKTATPAQPPVQSSPGANPRAAVSAKPPVQPTVQKPVSKPAPAPAQPVLPDNEHKWGNYVPKGTVMIETGDGKVHTAVANSLILCPEGDRGGMLSGFKTKAEQGEGEETIYFSDIESVSRDGEKLVVTDIDFDEYEIELKQAAEYWFIGEENSTELSTLKAADVTKITFDRKRTPQAPIRFGRVTMSGGSFLSPVAYIWFHQNIGRGIPSLKFTKDISSLAPSPLKLKSVKRILVTKNGREGTGFSASTDMEMTAYLKNGEEMNLVLSGRYDSFFAMSANGVARNLSRNDLKEIVLDDQKDDKPEKRIDPGIVPDIPLPTEEHKWGSFIPKGTALIKTNDGTIHTAIASSLAFCTRGPQGSSWDALFNGFQTSCDENREIIYFTDTETAVRNGDKLEVLDVNDEKTEIELHPNEELWFIGEKDGFMPSTVKAADIAEITFDRSKTPATPIRYGIITTDQGSFLSPVAFIFYYWNVGRTIPSLKYTKDITSIAPSPLKLKRVKKITVTQNGKEGTMISASTNMEMTATLKNGEEMKLVLSGRYDGFQAMSANGVMRGLSRSVLREINMVPNDNR